MGIDVVWELARVTGVFEYLSPGVLYIEGGWVVSTAEYLDSFSLSVGFQGIHSS
jgi:hypothetical protein